MNSVLMGVLVSAISAGTVIILAALGELLAERSGVQNLGLEGIIAMGAVTAILAESRIAPNPYIGLLIAILVGLILGAVFAFATVTFKANQVLCGLGMAFLGNGLSAKLGTSISGLPAPSTFETIRIPLLAEIPFIGNLLFNQSLLVYLAYFVFPPLVYFLLYQTRHGMHVRAVGDNPATADVCGIPVNKIRFIYTCVGGAFAGMSGAYITLAYTPSWVEGIAGGRGWIAIALVIFGAWKPLPVVFGALLFGGVTSLGFVGQLQDWAIPSAYLSMLPYLSTIALMIFPVLLKGKNLRRISASPAGLGQPYLREG
ncbi:MAG: ABC transporter permease [Anaerolineaceae bacterium]|nr:ABC transporter permease [Anaerolineaceae bacterium]